MSFFVSGLLIVSVPGNVSHANTGCMYLFEKKV